MQYPRRVKTSRALTLTALLLSLAALLPELLPSAAVWEELARYLDFLLLAVLITEMLLDARSHGRIGEYLRQSILPTAFLLVFLLLAAYGRMGIAGDGTGRIIALARGVIVLRSGLLLLGVFRRLRRFSVFFETVTFHPAQTILYSFIGAIVIGTLLLMLPVTTTDSGGLGLLNALFTATSAVCVTGLVVVDTAGLTLWGQLIVLLLIQAGGLGIMIISYFSLFAARQRVSLEEKMLLSYILDERNMNAVAGRVKAIIYTTLLIEAAGTLLLLPGMRSAAGDTEASGIFYAIFHSVSAFCNAGFALFSDSLTRFADNPAVITTVAVLIILGGLSFSVLVNAGETAFDAFRRRISPRSVPSAAPRLSLNSRVVLHGSGLLLITGLLLFYLLAHGGTLAAMPTGSQYLQAFFQSVTLRTAGFNTVAVGELSVTALLVLIPFMFIGGASGSTAGGIKVNNAAIIAAYIRATFTGDRSVVISQYSVGRERVNRAFLVFYFGIAAIAIGTVLLSAAEEFALEQLLFEAVSAFGTVGLSTGITGELSAPGRIIIILLMYIGRVGPLTILAAASRPSKGLDISYPRGDILL